MFQLEEVYDKLHQAVPENQWNWRYEGYHRNKVLEVPLEDQSIFDIFDIASHMSEMTLTKRNVVSLVTKFYDPLGMILPIIARLKMFLCWGKGSLGWKPHWRTHGYVVIIGQRSPSPWKFLDAMLCLTTFKNTSFWDSVMHHNEHMLK